MVALIVITVLAFLHVVSAMGWLGGGVLILSAVTPGIRSMSPATLLEFSTKVGPKINRFFIGSASATIIFGLALLGAMGMPNINTVYAGAGIGLLAYLDGMLVAIRSFRKADRLAQEAIASGHTGPPPREMLAALKRGGIGTMTGVLLLVIAAALMVASGFPF